MRLYKRDESVYVHDQLTHLEGWAKVVSQTGVFLFVIMDDAREGEPPIKVHVADVAAADEFEAGSLPPTIILGTAKPPKSIGS